MTTTRVAVVGAGMAGLSCARTLAAAGWQVSVFEKSRGLGGRMAVRRTDDGLGFDHGAQYFTVRDARFAELVKEWEQQGVAARWDGTIVTLKGGTVLRTATAVPRYVGVPGMNAVCKQLAAGLDLQFGSRAVAPQRQGIVWNLISDQGVPLGNFDEIVVAVPAPQAAELLAASSKLAKLASRATMSPCWVVLLQLPHAMDTGWDAAFVQDSPLAWLCRNSSKPSRRSENHPGAETWVLHASPDWSEEHLELKPEQILNQLTTAFWLAINQPVQPATFSTAHRWRFALPNQSAAALCLRDRDLRISACGDWCAEPRVEGAYVSGRTLAERLLSD